MIMPSQEELDNLIDKFWSVTKGFSSRGAAKSAINSLTLKQVIALIGEDETTVGLGMNIAGHKVIARNALRAQQRKSAERIWS